MYINRYIITNWFLESVVRGKKIGGVSVGHWLKIRSFWIEKGKRTSYFPKWSLMNVKEYQASLLVPSERLHFRFHIFEPQTLTLYPFLFYVRYQGLQNLYSLVRVGQKRIDNGKILPIKFEAVYRTRRYCSPCYKYAFYFQDY